jgi:branched-subunit amino acid ABC-type transport system permease component
MLNNPTFVLTQFLNGLSLGMNLFIIAAGLTLVLGVLRVLNFAHGAFYMVGAYVTYSVTRGVAGMTGNYWLGVLAAMLAVGFLSLVVERVFLRHLYGREQIYQLLFTFALVLIIGDFVRAVWGSNVLSIPFPAGLGGATNLGPIAYPSYRLFLSVAGIVIAVFLWFLTQRTRWGRQIRAATQDREMLAALGLNVPFIYASVFVLGGALAGLGGALAAPAIALDPGMDAEIIVLCFIIVIIGGLGSLWGALLGALLLGQIRVFGVVLIPELEIVFVYLLLMTVLILRPWGLLGRPGAL